MDFRPVLHNISEDDKTFITRNLDGSNKKNGRSSVSFLLYKIYVGTTILDLSTESRFISFVIFYRYLCQYRTHCNSHYVFVNGNNERYSTGSDERLSNPQKHLGKIAAAALFLACKITNENRRIRDVINVYHILKFNQWSGSFLSSHQSSSVSATTRSSNVDSSRKKIGNSITLKGKPCQGQGGGGGHMTILFNCRDDPPLLDEEYWKFKEEIVKIEHHLLRVLNFDVHDMVISPYRIIVTIIEHIINLIADGGTVYSGWNKITNVKNRKHMIFQQILKHAWVRVNDALFYIDAMAVKNSDLACGALALAFEEEGRDQNELQHVQRFCWWQWVDVNLHELNAAKAVLTEATESLSSLRIHATIK